MSRSSFIPAHTLLSSRRYVGHKLVVVVDGEIGVPSLNLTYPSFNVVVTDNMHL